MNPWLENFRQAFFFAIDYDPQVIWLIQQLVRHQVSATVYLGPDYAPFRKCLDDEVDISDLQAEPGVDPSLWRQFVAIEHVRRINTMIGQSKPLRIFTLNAPETEKIVKRLKIKPLRISSWIHSSIHLKSSKAHLDISELYHSSIRRERRSKTFIRSIPRILIFGGSIETGRGFASLQACAELLKLGDRKFCVNSISNLDEGMSLLDIFERKINFSFGRLPALKFEKFISLLFSTDVLIIASEGAQTQGLIRLAKLIGVDLVLAHHRPYFDGLNYIGVDINSFDQIYWAIRSHLFNRDRRKKKTYQISASLAEQIRFQLDLRSGLSFPKFTGSELAPILMVPINERAKALSVHSLTYVSRLIGGGVVQKEWNIFVQSIRMNQTQFFRHKTSLDELSALIRKYERTNLRILCLGSSTGEEAFSLAVMLMEDHPKSIIQIDAIDQNKRLIQYAKFGAYPKSLLKTIPRNYRKKRYLHSHLDQKRFTFSQEVRSKIRFQSANILDFRAPLNVKYDVIFCRNVLYYMSTDYQSLIFRKITSWIRLSGYLVLGANDSVKLPKSEWLSLKKHIFLKPSKQRTFKLLNESYDEDHRKQR